MKDKHHNDHPDGKPKIGWKEIAKVLYVEPGVQELLPDELRGMSFDDFVQAFACPFEIVWDGRYEEL